MKKSNKGFTLLELLVVVLIIGILAAIALPQYQVVIKKAKLADYITMVKALYTAEDSYFLMHGRYTSDLNALDISFPLREGCIYYEDSYCSVFECGESWYGVCDNISNVQAGTKEFTKHKLRYLQFLEDHTFSDGRDFRRGDVVCMAIKPAERKACKSLGRYEIAHGNENNTEVWYRYSK